MSDDTVLIKCLVWDLDNTLWNGTLLEDAEVNASQEIRDLIVALDARGILQSVASKNDHDHAWARLEALGLAEYFVLPQIGWGRKSASVQAIADELKFAPSTIAFVDDQPAERAEVKYHCPQVRCYDAAEILTLADRIEFMPKVVTVDARQRRSMYQAGFRRDTERESYDGPDEDFLRSLQLEMRIKRADETDLTRVEELTLRTSQMNATGVHYSDADLRALLLDPDHDVLTVSMTDRFGPHGAVGVLLLAYHEAVWQVKLLATSCRVVSFGAGATLLNWLIDAAATAGVHLAADFRPTDRNRMMDIAYRFAGFTDDECACLAEIAGTDRAEIQLRHLVAAARPESATITLSAPVLGRAASAVRG